MTKYDPTPDRLQLRDIGYYPLPNIHKHCYVDGWNSPEFMRREIPRIEGSKGKGGWLVSWDRFKSTGVRVQGGLAALDFDIDDVLINALFDQIKLIAPAVYDAAPTRYGKGTHRVMWICRTDATHKDITSSKLISRKYHRPGDPIGEGQRVEIFWSEAGSEVCKAQFGAYGAHSLNDDGSVKIKYRWEGVPLHEVPPSELPLITAQQMHAVIDAFEALAAGAGWELLSTKRFDGNSAIIRDIDVHTVFDLQDGSKVSYTELCAMYDPDRGLRCTSTFHGDPGSNASKCRAGEVRVLGGVIGIWDTEECAWHVPERPGAEGLPELKAIVAEAGVEAPVFPPNWRDRYKNGAPKQTLDNAQLAIDDLGLHCSLDVFHNRAWIGRSEAAPPTEPLEPFIGEIDDHRLLALRRCLDRRYGFDPGEKNVRDVVMGLAWDNSFNPVAAMLDEAEAAWDGKKRLDRMAVDFFNCDNTPVSRAFVRLTMLAAVARVRDPGCKFDQILVMESPEGWNKSTAWRVLAGEGNFSDASIIGHAGREVQEQLADIWIHENAELAGMRKAEVEVVKAFASRQEDRARPAYGHFLINQPRHSIEVGTTNSYTYLLSNTGNRRFWPVTIRKAIDIPKLKAARLQLWGEAATLQRQGASLVLDPALWVDAAIVQESRRAPDPWEDRIEEMTHVVTTGPIAGLGPFGNGIVHAVDGEDRVATSAIFEHVLRITNGQLDIRHSKRLADLMRMKGWEPYLFKLDGKPVKGYRRTTK